GDYASAYMLAGSVRRHLGTDSSFQALLADVTDEITIRSTPAGASVYLATFGDSTVPDSSDGTLIGTTPVERYTVARGDHRIVLRAPGHLPARRILSRSLTRTAGMRAADRFIEVDVTLAAEGAVPDGMEPVPGGPYEIVGHDVGRGMKTRLEPFALDRYEVSNEQYALFVRSGRYPAGRVDRTGLPGPRDWRNGEPPSDALRHPVTGVSWDEAAAYCAWRGARLPTLFEWEKASRNGLTLAIGFFMPWGQYDPRGSGRARANISSRGTVPVDSFGFAISPFGIYNMAGNVKEWLANPLGDGHATAGGSWQDPAYVFTRVGSDASAGSPALGFRCARTLSQSGGDQGGGRLPLVTETPVYEPVGPAEFRSLLAHYRYDPIPANPRGRTVEETPDWIRERLWIDGLRGDSILIYLFLPRNAEPPYQTIVSIPSSAAFFAQPVPVVTANVAGGQIKAGRAVLAPVLAWMIERQPEPYVAPPPASVAFRDLMIQHATEMRLAMDYAATRGDIDTTRFAYLSVSFGAASRIGLAAVDPRLRAAVLIGTGVDERLHPTLPEAANINFAPYLAVPKLVINGRQDEEHPWETRGKAMWELLRDPKQLLLVEGAGHVPPPEARTAPINAFLDSTLGPVRRR
ncbi:MAG: SUMF1/EgtB/PvdO family nonheme iron enzyme, partial [Gemmatimonadota bacterium]|nr:SUMF1/EgtB/PvdO family nonheme iron enzyme [Gemmatimonadota bacterium]